jgi:hypothetical protein
MCQAWFADGINGAGRSTGARCNRGALEIPTIVLQLHRMNPNWQRASIQAAAAYLRQVIARTPTDARAKAVYEGLLDVLDPSRRTARLQRERAASAAAVPVAAARERRATHERRSVERRKANLGSPTGVERRDAERRTGRDRRSGSGR